MTGERKLHIIPMQVQQGRNDLVNHVLRHFVCAEHPFDYGSRPPFGCPKRGSLRAAIEAAHPAAKKMLDQVQRELAKDLAAIRAGKKGTLAKRAIRDEKRWWTRPAILEALRAAHDQGYAVRYLAYILDHPLPGDDGAQWFRVPKQRSRFGGRNARAVNRETKSTPLRRFEKHPGSMRLGIYVVVADWEGSEDRMCVKTAHVAEGMLSNNPAYASNEAERKQLAVEARKKLEKIGGKLSARGGRRRLSEQERRKLLQLR